MSASNRSGTYHKKPLRGQPCRAQPEWLTALTRARKPGRMQHDWVGSAILIGLMGLFFLFGGLVLRKMRSRREREFADDVTPPARLDSPPPVTPIAEPEPEPDVEPATPEAVVPAVAPQVAVKPVVDAALQAGLAKTQASFLGRINQIFSRQPQVDAAILDDLEEVLLTADVGVTLATRFLDELRSNLRAKKLQTADAIRDALRERLLTALQAASSTHGADVFATPGKRPKVILFVGVNGVGKTTTIGKIAAQLQGQGQSVLLAAGDTFRAAAAEQLGIWAQRSGARIVRGAEGADPASVMFNAVEAAVQHDVDVVLADTAGRLHTKTELMDEIKKVQRAVGKARPGAPDETWLVVDATTGQNALQQAREFHAALGLTGVILTKLDGTAKGGVVVAIVDALKIPVCYIGVGEAAADLRPFDAEQFIAALFSDGA